MKDEAEVEPCGATSRVALLAGLTYWTSFNTACWAWFACCRAAIPVDSRTLYWVMLATVVPMSAFCRLLTALCRFVTWSLITVVAALSRLTEAPMVPRCAETASDGGIDCRQRRLGGCCTGQGIGVQAQCSCGKGIDAGGDIGVGTRGGGAVTDVNRVGTGRGGGGDHWPQCSSVGGDGDAVGSDRVCNYFLPAPLIDYR